MASTLATILAGSTVGVTIATPFFLFWMSKAKTFVTSPKEGTAEAVMLNEQFDHLILVYEDRHLNTPGKPWYDESQPKWEILDNIAGENYDDRNWLLKLLGLYYVGMPPFRTIHSYLFEWSEMRKKNTSQGAARSIWDRSEVSHFLRVVAFPYVIRITGAKSKEGIPLVVVLQVTLRILNPYRAWFGTDNWIEVVTGAITSGVRNFTGAKSYSDLTSEAALPDGTVDATGSDRLSTSLIDLNIKLTDGTAGLHARYGVVIDMTDIQEMEIDAPEDEKKQLLLDTLRRYNADNLAYAIETEGRATAAATLAKGDAGAQVITLQGAAKAGAIKAKGEARGAALRARLEALRDGGELGIVLAQTEAMKAGKGDRTILWANNPWVQKVPGLAGILTELGFSIDDLKAFVADKSPSAVIEPPAAEAETDKEVA